MSSYHRALLNRWTIYFLLLLIVHGLLSGCRFFRGGAHIDAPMRANAPPTPQVPSSELKMPEPVKSEEIKGQATLPEELPLGFALDVAGKIAGDDWDLQGTVTSIENRIVILRTEKGESARLVYRLPKEVQLPLKVGQPVSIKKSFVGFEGRTGSALLIISEGKSVLAAGRVFGEQPLEAKIPEGLSLRQIGERKTVLNQNQYDTLYQVPVSAASGGRTIDVPMGKPTALTLQGKSFLALVTESTESSHTREQERTAEGRGYMLEYVITLQADLQAPQ
jgi:hypothetical protein